jgi:hypothetical protein
MACGKWERLEASWTGQNMASKGNDQVAVLRLRICREQKIDLRNIVVLRGNGSRINCLGDRFGIAFPRTGSNKFERFFSYTIVLWIRYLLVPWLLPAFDPLFDIDIIDRTPRLRVFLQLSQDLIAIDQEVAASLLSRAPHTKRASKR